MALFMVGTIVIIAFIYVIAAFACGGLSLSGCRSNSDQQQQQT